MGYERPSITRRESIVGLATAAPSDPIPKQSDVNKKDNVVPVAWAESSETPPLRYETPSVARRESIVGLASAAPSDLPPDTIPSDIAKKDNVLPVEWSEPKALRYETPGIARRESIAGLADAAPSDLLPDGQVSDVNVKDNVVPVRW
ncbi:MAG: hypothetical protein WDA60_12415 [Acidimicrobiia bacterium]|jgi:hypothetical protein